MKILHVVSYFPPDRIGGVGEVVSHLHKGLLNEGHESVVLTTGTLHDNPLILRIASTPFKFLISLIKYVKKAKGFDLVHCQQGETIIFPFFMKIFRISTPVLVSFHGGHQGMIEGYCSYKINGQTIKTGWKGLKYRILTARFHRFTNWISLRLADSTSFISYSSAVDVLGSEKAKKANVIYNGIPTADINIEKSLPEPAEMLYIGNSSHRKRVNVLPFLLKYVRRSIPDAKLRLIGFELNSCLELKRLFEEFDLMDAVFSDGELPSSFEIHPYYRVSKVLLVPSIYEGLPMVILEALQNGLPCVATRVSGHPEVIKDGQNGFLVDKDNPRQMADRCVEILGDNKLQQKLGQAGRQLVRKQFNLKKMVSEYLNLYNRICEK